MKTVLIAGGSGGIGGATAKRAGAGGWHVFIGYRSGETRARALVEEIQKAGGQAEAISLPLDETDARGAGFEQLATRTKTLDALVISASPPPALAAFLKTRESELLTQFQVNVIGAHSAIVECWRRFFSVQKKGHVVGVLSEAAGRPPWGHMLSYVVAKRGLKAVLESAMVELGPAGLSATAVSPDYTETSMLTALHPHVLEAARAKRPFLSPDRVAERIVHALDHRPAAGQLLEEILTSN